MMFSSCNRVHCLHTCSSAASVERAHPAMFKSTKDLAYFDPMLSMFAALSSAPSLWENWICVKLGQEARILSTSQPVQLLRR